MKRNPDGYIRPLLEDIRQIRFWMACKTLLVAAPMLLMALFITLIWLTDEPPEAWRTTTARFKRVKHGAHNGRYSTSNVFLTMDGRGFTISDDGAEEAEMKLTQGALCQVTYSSRFGVGGICGLTSGGEVIVDRTQSEAAWARDQAEYPWLVGLLTGAAAVAGGLSNGLWCRKNRREIAQIEQRIAQREAKNEAREKKKAAQAAARTGQQA